MKKFIAYDKDTYRILGYIENDYSTFEDTKQIFQNYQNYEVIEADGLAMPYFYNKYKLVFEEGKATGTELIQEETDAQEEV